MAAVQAENRIKTVDLIKEKDAKDRYTQLNGSKRHRHRPISQMVSVSAPSSPRKLRRLHSEPTDYCSSGSVSTLTSDDAFSDLPDSSTPRDNETPQIVAPPLEDEYDGMASQFRPRTGTAFYHESFVPPPQVTHNPVMYIPLSHSAQQLTVPVEHRRTKQKGLFRRFRNSFKSRKPARRAVSDRSSRKEKRWIDHMDDLDPVSRPSYFRHIGQVISTGPGMVQTIELNRPSHGKFGFYIAQGYDEDGQSKSIFVSRFYQKNMDKFLASLLRPGDEILAINGQPVRELPIAKVTAILSGLETVQLTILPVTAEQLQKLQRPS